MNILLFAVAAAFVNNVVLVQFQGLCPFLGVSRNMKTAAGMGGAVIFVMTLANTVTSLIYYYVLVPLGIEYLNTIAFILILAGLVQFVEMFLRKKVPSLYKALGVYLPLITTNCAVLGIAISSVQSKLSVGMCILNGFFSAVGFAAAITILAGIREKMERNNIPKAFRGGPILLITAGLMAMAFQGLSGLM